MIIFDSGVGGLSIVQALQQQLPSLPLAYACDNAAFPYGEKPAAWLKARLVEVIGQLIAEINPCLVVLACNTASTLALAELRASFNLPFVGVVPAIKPAAKLSQTGVIALLATCGTIKRPYTQQLINSFAEDCTVIRMGSNKLVELAETYLHQGTLCLTSLEEVLGPLVQHQQLDTIILGCTHFPLLKAPMQKLAKQAGVNWQWVDSSEAIANRVACLTSHLTGFTQELAGSCWLTQDLSVCSQLPKALSKFNFHQLEVLPNLTTNPQVATAI